MVYIEQPVGVGFSYSNVSADYQTLNDDVAAADNAAFLSAFFAMYPRYQNLSLWLTSESYGGNYVPQMTRAVLTGSDARLAAQLKKGGFVVGNPVFSADSAANFATIMNSVTAEILYGHSLIPLDFYRTFVAAGCAVLSPPSSPCDALTSEMFALAGPCFESNACSDNLYNNPSGNATLGVQTAPSPDVDSLWGAWLNRADVQAAIHARAPPLPPWSDCANIGYDITWPSNIPDYQAAFEAKLKVLVMSGDVDMLTCPFASTQYMVDVLSKLPGQGVSSNWTTWFTLAQPAGYVEEHAGFTFATVKAAGHEAPGYEPLATYQLVSSFIGGKMSALTAPPPPPPAQARLSQSSLLRAAVRKWRQRA